jgi:hypothetical protein
MIKDMDRLMNMDLTEAIRTYMRKDIERLEAEGITIEGMRRETELMKQAIEKFGNIIYYKYKVDITKATSASSLSNRVYRLNT